MSGFDDRTLPLCYFPCAPQRGDATDYVGVHVRVRHQPQATIVTVIGDIDAYNEYRVSAYVADVMCGSGPFVLDLSGVDFVGVAAFQSLLSVGERCTQAGLEWALVSGDAVNPLLCVTRDADRLPIEASCDSALQRLTRAHRRFSQ